MKQASWALPLHRAPGGGVSPKTAPLPAACCSARCPPPCPVLPVPGPDGTHQGLLVLQRPLLRALGGGHGAPGAPGAPGRAGAGARGSSSSSARGRAGRTRGIARGRARPRSASAAPTAAPGTGTGQPGTDRREARRGSLRALWPRWPWGHVFPSTGTWWGLAAALLQSLGFEQRAPCPRPPVGSGLGRGAPNVLAPPARKREPGMRTGCGHPSTVRTHRRCLKNALTVALPASEWVPRPRSSLPGSRGSVLSAGSQEHSLAPVFLGRSTAARYSGCSPSGAAGISISPPQWAQEQLGQLEGLSLPPPRWHSMARSAKMELWHCRADDVGPGTGWFVLPRCHPPL